MIQWERERVHVWANEIEKEREKGRLKVIFVRGYICRNERVSELKVIYDCECPRERERESFRLREREGVLN